MSLGFTLALPLRVGLSVADTALGITEAVIGTVRIAVSPQTYSALGAVGFPDARSSMGLLQQLSTLTSEDRGLGQAMRPGGPLDRLLEPGGPVDRLTAPRGLLDRLLEPGGALDRLTAPGGPLDRVLADDGALDRLLSDGGLLDRMTAPEGPLERLLAQDGAVERLTAPGGIVDVATRPGGVVERALAPGGVLEVLLAEQGALDRLLTKGGPLDQIESLAATLAELTPGIISMNASVDMLRETVELLRGAVGPLGDLAGRLPGRWLRGGKGELIPPT
ncbi:ABC transporter [Rhodococcus sp. NPDC058639]|uniref:ABC transporter n=1 Tax=unclassified Rhodococcus (in: high G+C Gram-positive bacteria) TaxID=192944 RepID=UPI00364D0692